MSIVMTLRIGSGVGKLEEVPRLRITTLEVLLHLQTRMSAL